MLHNPRADRAAHVQPQNPCPSRRPQHPEHGALFDRIMPRLSNGSGTTSIHAPRWTLWRTRKSGAQSLNRSNDALAAAIDICADLHDRRAAVAACQGRQHWFQGYAGDLYATPCQSIDVKDNAHFLSDGRLWVSVENHFGGGIGNGAFHFDFPGSDAYIELGSKRRKIINDNVVGCRWLGIGRSANAPFFWRDQGKRYGRQPCKPVMAPAIGGPVAV